MDVCQEVRIRSMGILVDLGCVWKGVIDVDVDGY